jgi:hypothetical protein
MVTKRRVASDVRLSHIAAGGTGQGNHADVGLHRAGLRCRRRRVAAAAIQLAHGHPRRPFDTAQEAALCRRVGRSAYYMHDWNAVPYHAHVYEGEARRAALWEMAVQVFVDG